MDTLQGLLDTCVAEGRVTGAVALVAGHGDLEVAVAGHRDLARAHPMTRDTVFRISSMTKPITAAVLLGLVEEGRLGLDDPIGRWLPELAEVQVVRTPASPVDDLVPLDRPITVEHLLTMTAGWGWASDFGLPAIGLLAERVERQGVPHDPRTPEQWLTDLASVPLLTQPGTTWLYNTCSDLQGVLISRVLGQDLPTAFAERLLRPLGMTETGFVVPEPARDRFAEAYVVGDGEPAAIEEPAGSFLELPGFAPGAGGLVSNVDDLLAFARCLTGGGAPVLSADTVRTMTTNHIADVDRELGSAFLDGQGWGYGGGVDVSAEHAWQVPGRYGWVGGSGTSCYVNPDTGGISIVLTQRQMGSPEDFQLMAEVGTYAARVFRALA